MKLQRTGQTDIAASNVAVSGTTAITCRLSIPVNAVNGTWDVVVTNTDGQQGRRTGGFTITTASPIPAPTVVGIYPSSGKIRDHGGYYESQREEFQVRCVREAPEGGAGRY